MSKLYIDCTNGISGDMVLMALKELGAEADIEEALHYQPPEEHHHHHHDHDHDHHHHHDHDHEHHHHDHGHGEASEEAKAHNSDHHHHHDHTHEHHHSHASYGYIARLIDGSDLSYPVKAQAKAIYRVIARAEGEVHGAPMEEVHFHEVGRKEAILQIVGVAQALEELDVDEVFCSPVHDGKGEIECSHGIIPVPVPAVAAMMKESDLTFVTDDIDTEMVTPSGLGILMGIGAVCTEEAPGEYVKMGRGVGTRDIGRDGLKIYLL